ncbi:MAG TPA: iron-sulfur cluster repair di-iron protein [Thermoanaerobaculia bacterium]|nr:iron-sulfur cluster repair di-iron protein [Thermoanaerobaculia bacterium]
MQTQPNTIAELAVAMPQAIGTLDKLGIDYCCNGTQSIADACNRAGITTDELLAQIPAKAGASERDWTTEPMSSLIQFIVRTHHDYTRQALATLQQLVVKVREHHGPRHAELSDVERLVNRLAEDLVPHMLKEEQVLFPYIGKVEEAAMLAKEPPMPFFGTARNPIRAMMMEHEAAGEILVEIRALTSDFTLPPEACASFNALYTNLQEIESDLHRHIHLENNILFPHAIETEEATRTSAVPAFADNCCGHK